MDEKVKFCVPVYCYTYAEDEAQAVSMVEQFVNLSHYSELDFIVIGDDEVNEISED